MTHVPFELRPEDVLTELWPPAPTTGMTTGAMPSGVKVMHRPSGVFVVCNVHRSAHQNRAMALEELTSRLRSGQLGSGSIHAEAGDPNSLQ